MFHSVNQLVKSFIKMITLSALFLLNTVSADDDINHQSERSKLPLVKTLKVSNAHMPEFSPVSRTGAVYLTLKNNTTLDRVLIGASTNIARHTMFHQTIESNGSVKMKHIDELTIKVNDQVVLASGGIHLMLMGLQKRPFSNPFELVLEFNDGQQQIILVDIIKPK